MAACSFQLDSRTGRHDILWPQSFWTQKIGENTGILQRSLSRQSSRTQSLANNDTETCSSLATNPDYPRECLAGERFSSEGRRQELLWRQFFLDHTLWWDNRQKKKCCSSPDFRHKKSPKVLWLKNFHKPAWVDAQLAALDMEMVRRAHTSKPNLSDDLDPRRPAGYEKALTAEAVSQLCQQGQLSEAVEALEALVRTHSRISKPLFYAVLKQCIVKKDLVLGRRVHTLTVKKGYESDTFLCNHILRMYASHAMLQEAMDVFTVVDKPDAFMWSSIISAHVTHGQAKQAIQLYHQMRRSSVKPDGHVFVAALQACTSGVDLQTGQQVHADVLDSGVEPDLFVCSCLVDMYAKCGSLKDARTVFEGISRKDVVTWNAMISGYAQKGMGQEALSLYSAMQQEGIAAPDSVTFLCLLQACASVGISAMAKGKQLHAQVEEQGLQADMLVACSLVNMYAKFGCLEDAQRVFDRLRRKDVVTWNAMIAGYAQQGMGQEALSIYSSMQQEGLAAPDSVTYLCLLQAYAKCGRLEDAQRVFDGLRQKDVVTWNAMIAGYAQQGMGQEALCLYGAMQQEGITVPDSVTFVCLLQACASVAALHQGRQLHAQIEEHGLEADVFVATNLINMYAKSGSMDDAQQVFDALPERDIVAWNALIAGHTRQGDSESVFNLVHRMKGDCIQPNAATFLSVLTVCSHAGLVNKGRKYFEAMSRHYGITPNLEHYTCMVDLLGRAGLLDEALEVVRTMPVQPHVSVWHALLGACQKWSNVDVGRHAFDEAVKVDEKDASAYAMMSNIYTGAQMWDEAQEIQARRKTIGAWKEQPAQSWWTDMSGIVHAFLVGDKQHPESEGEGIYARLIESYEAERAR